MILIHTKYTFGITENFTYLPQIFAQKILLPPKRWTVESNQTGTETTGRRIFFCAGEEGRIRCTILLSENEVDREIMLQVSRAFDGVPEEEKFAENSIHCVKEDDVKQAFSV